MATKPDVLRHAARVFRNPNLRRIQLAFAAVVLGGSAYQVGLAVAAFEAGGEGGVGVAFAVQVVPLVLAAPFTSALADRYPRRRVMLVIDGLKCVCTTAVAVTVAADGPLWLVLVLGAPGAIASTGYAPASRALLPSLADDPEELSAANALTSGVEHAAMLAGPAIAGLLVAARGAELAFAIGAVLFAASVVALLRISPGHQDPSGAAEPSQPWWRGAGAGLRLVGTDRSLRVLVVLYAGVTLVAGAIQVLAVVLARDLVGLGDAGVGAFYSALGVGGLVASVAALGLTRRPRLSGTLVAGSVLLGGPLVVLGLAPATATALGGLAVVGFANVVVDVSIITILQRAVPDEILGRVFGVLETTLLGMFGLGTVVAPILGATLSSETAFVVLGVLPPVLGLLLWGRLRAIDVPAAATEARVSLLRGIEIFAPLPEPAIEALAGHLVAVAAAPGETIVRQGEAGDRYFVIEDGAVTVVEDGRTARVLTAGCGFGEIALLRDEPRTASVVADGPTRLYALDRDAFLSAVTGHPQSAAAADAVIASRLARRSISVH